MREKLTRFFTTPAAGITGMVVGIFWESFAEGAGPEIVYVIASLQAIGTLFLENWTLKKNQEPRLFLVWSTGQIFDSLHDGGHLRILRVGVRNSGESVPTVSVKVARVHPELPRVFPMQELQQTHAERGTSRFTVNKSEEPLVFVDLIYQTIYTDSGEARGTRNGREYVEKHQAGATSRMWFQFAHGERDIPVDVDQYLVWLAIDGIGAEHRRKFVLRRNAKGQYDISRAGFPD